MDSETTTIDAQFHVLAVDDSIIDRKLIERLLKTSSYRVTAVPSVSKALEFLGLHNDQDDEENEEEQEQRMRMRRESSSSQVAVNLIISDYSMPDMTGYDLLRKIKDSDSFKDIPFVIMSSENIPSRINRCLEEGAEEFFLKPVKMSDVNKLKPYLMRDRASSSSLKNGAKRKSMEDGFLPYRSRSRFINNNNLEMSC